jgi:ribose transport system substrate-binding protein
MNRHLLASLCLLAGIALLAGCAGRSPAPRRPSGATGEKFYWVQPLKGHPVHQMTQIGFREGCQKLGYKCEILGTDGPDVAGTIALAEEALARGDAAGIAIWTGNPAFNPFIEKAGRAGVPVILPHFPVPKGSVPGATGIISCDPAQYAREAALKIGEAIGGNGTVAITQGSFNTTENMVSETFKQTMSKQYPRVRVLAPEEEGFDPPKAIAKAIAILQAHPDIVAALSTTGGGATTWASAQKETGRKIVAVGMDYTRVNLDLVRSGQIYAVIGQPLWEESYGAAKLLDRVVRGKKIPWWTKLPAPLITRDKVAPYYDLVNKVERAIKG